MKPAHNRVDPAVLTKREIAELGTLAALLQGRGGSRLKGPDGREVRLPKAIAELLAGIFEGLRRGDSFLVIPEDHSLTTRAAADYLGMTPQYLAGLLDAGEIPCHKAGTHRRLKFGDLERYARKRDKLRRESLDRLFRKVDEAGLYDASYAGHE